MNQAQSTARPHEQSNLIEPQVAVGQMSSQDDIDANLKSVAKLLANAKASGARLLVLPENMACFAQGKQHQTAERFDEICQKLSHLVAQHELWLVAGTLPCPYRPNGQAVPDHKLRSASMVFDPSGQIVGRYDKIHLFDARIRSAQPVDIQTAQYRESDVFESGEQPVTVSTTLGTLGLMICYDLRFPELALTLRQQGADMIAAPAAFTHTTGKAHWELLLRARAIDTQCHFFGAAQTGTHGDKRTWGHSMICDAWGNTLCRLNETANKIAIAKCAFTSQNKLRLDLRLMHTRQTRKL